MGDRYNWEQACPSCGKMMLVYYAKSCGYTDVTCHNCKTEFDIILDFVLRPKDHKHKQKKARGGMR